MREADRADGYCVRLALPEEVGCLPAIEVAAAALFPVEDVPPSIDGDPTSVESFAEAQRAGTLWVAVDASNTPVGFALVEALEGHAHLEELDVLLEHGRRGLGTQLVEAVIAWARANRRGPVTLTTFRHLPWNAPFYTRMGFRILSDAELSAGLRAILDNEIAEGFAADKRVAMQHDL